jgi:aldose sugar dehydrogenase
MRYLVTAISVGLLAVSCQPLAKSAGPIQPDKLPFALTEMGRFDEPWAMAFAPGSDFALITQKKGKLLLWREGAASVEVLGVPAVDYGGQGGLGDVIFAPDFATSGNIYLSWAAAGDNGTRGAVVAIAKLNIEDGALPKLSNIELIWRQHPKVSGRGHYGHRMAFGPDGFLYIASGERQKMTPAQEIRSSLGKIVRVDPKNGLSAPDNPFRTEAVTREMRMHIVPNYSSAKAQTDTWSLGHRNPLGLAFDADGRLWDSEMGPAGGDELNLVKAGANYGWPKASNGSHYDGREIPDHKAGDGFEAPKVFWTPSISPSSLMIYSGTLFPQWKGDAFIGALSGEALIRVDLNGENAAKADQWQMGTRIREVEQGPDGAIWLLEDGDNGRLMKLTPKSVTAK